MSTRVKLYFRKLYIPKLSKLDLYAIRLPGRVTFKTHTGLSKPYPAIIDTGAPISLIPSPIWESAITKKIKDYKVKGLNPKEECSIPACIGEIECILFDEVNQTELLKVRAYLAYTDEVLLVIGFKDLLEKFEVQFNFDENKAFIEWETGKQVRGL